MKYKYFIISLLIIIIDQLTKFYMKNKNFDFGLISLNYTTNTGAAFGILQGYRFLLVLISLFISILILIYLFKTENKLLSYALSFLLGGTIGNLIDRIFLGFVIDFINIKIWPIFNVADTFNTVGAFLLVVYLLKIK